HATRCKHDADAVQITPRTESLRSRNTLPSSSTLTRFVGGPAISLQYPAGDHDDTETGGKGIRTPGLLIANETLYQLSYTPVVSELRLARAADFSSTETTYVASDYEVNHGVALSCPSAVLRQFARQELQRQETGTR